MLPPAPDESDGATAEGVGPAFTAVLIDHLAFRSTTTRVTLGCYG